MIGAHQTTAWLARLARTLTDQIPTPDGPLTAASVIGTIRNDLLPHIVGGPGYNRAADDNLRRALDAYQRDDAEGTLRWLHDAVLATRPARTYDQLAAENERLRAAIRAVRDIDPYCDLSVASGLMRVVRLTDIEKALAAADENAA